jgi:ElaB/YqjD/DUF883 family membrane-anchored ribosome-binding protein
MEGDAARLLEDLHKLTNELESYIKGNAGKFVGTAGERMRAGLTHARERIAAIEGEFRASLKHGADATDHYVRANPWQSIGIAAAVAFIVGALVSRRD